MMSWLDVPAVRTALNVGGPGTKPHEKNNLAYTRAGAADLRFVRVRVRTPLPARTAGRRRARAVRCTSGSPSGIGSGSTMGKMTGASPGLQLGSGLQPSGFRWRPWHPWFGSPGAGGSRVAAGYATVFAAAKDFRFITVKGAGHEVPTFKPAAAFDLFSAFLRGAPL